MNTKHRSILILTGKRSSCLTQCQPLLEISKTLLISYENQNNKPYLDYKQVNTQLGQEHSLVIFDATKQFEANALGVISGTIIGGGCLVLLLPEPPYSHYPNTNFLVRLLKIAKQFKIPTYKAGCQEIPLLTALTASYPSAKHTHTSTAKGLEITLGPEQAQVISAVTKVAKGHRKRPLVLTADRGRGKSTALGVAARTLLESGLKQIIVCAPAKAMVKPLLNQVEHHSGIHYFAPDQLDRQKPETELLIIDEAGAIPVPLLSRLLKHYPRVVFSTTLQGYEGNGKGFAIRFQKQLDTVTPNWQSLELQSPIRWGKRDPLEQLINEALLLNAEPNTAEHFSTAMATEVIYQQLTAKQLTQNEKQLRQLFGLLIIAHYQTRPSDLLQLLDSPNISIHVLSFRQNILAAAIVSHEGGLSNELSQQIYEGKRRPQGHLVPQILTFQLGMLQAATLTTDRIMRIAVHPDCQRMHLGSKLLNLIHRQSSADYLSSSFGMNKNLLNFWASSGFHTAHLGLRREASSGYHSAVMLCPLTFDGSVLLQVCQKAFERHFLAQLGDPFKDYEPSIALALIQSGQFITEAELNAQEQLDIERFANSYCGYDLVMSALQHWLPSALADNQNRISETDAALLLMRVLQHHDWGHCCKILNLQGKQHALKAMQQAVAKLMSPSHVTNYPGKD